jgi:hypothetical protein
LLTSQSKSTANSTGVRINNIFVDSEVPLPLLSEDFVVSSDINKSISVDVSVSSHLSLLEGLLDFLKISALFKLEKNKSLRIHLLGARKSVVNEFELDAYINSSKLNARGKSFVDMLRNNELFVVTDILKCKKYTIESIDKKDSRTEFKVDAPKIGEGGVEVKSGKNITDTSVYEGDDYITIALKAYKIYYKKDEDTGEETYRIRKDEVLKIVLDDEDFPGETLNTETINFSNTHERV